MHNRARVRCPVLVLNGGPDHQVAPQENQAGILPSLNHAFQTARTGKEDEYEKLDDTMAPAAMQKIADFARAPTRGREAE